MRILTENQAGAVFPVVKFSFPPQRALVIRDEKICYLYPEYELKRSQDLEPQYHDCGQFYLNTTESFRTYRSPVTPNTVPLIVSEEEVQDIDTPEDWSIAEQKYKTFILPKQKG